MTTISAKTILRSRNTSRPDKILSTLLLRYPRWIHAEFMTHRVFTRNASSSRAIPVERLIQDIENDPAEPLWWGKNRPGMQAPEELTGPHLARAKTLWKQALGAALYHARQLADLGDGTGAHKQIVNRILEPFSHINVLVSATEWSNFFALRIHKDAEPHIQLLAKAIKAELDRADNIQDLEPGQWHLPFVDTPHEIITQRLTISDFQKLSVARCAALSYMTVEGEPMTVERAEKVYAKLAGPPLHASPFEHAAQADCFLSDFNEWAHPEQHANFVGFRQLRKMMPNECL